MAQLAQEHQPISHGELRTSIWWKRSNRMDGWDGGREGRRRKRYKMKVKKIWVSWREVERKVSLLRSGARASTRSKLERVGLYDIIKTSAWRCLAAGGVSPSGAYYPLLSNPFQETFHEYCACVRSNLSCVFISWWVVRTSQSSRSDWLLTKEVLRSRNLKFRVYPYLIV